MKVRGNILVKTYMEVLDYLLENNLFVVSSEKDFLDSRYNISEYGFIKETQVYRGVWADEIKDKENEQDVWNTPMPTTELITTYQILYVLNKNLTTALKTYKIPAHKDEYAYLHDNKGLQNEKEKIYFKSYRDMLRDLKSVKQDLRMKLETEGKILGLSLAKTELVKRYKSLSNQQKRAIECYAKFESELLTLLNTFVFDYYGDEIPEENIEKVLNKTIDLESFIEFVSYDFENKYENNLINTHGAYSSFSRNQYISSLGLDGLTI